MQLYIHVPFCKSKCRYCDFNSYACHDKQAIFEYLNVLDDEIRLASEQYGKEKTDTIYVGGGTPSLIEGSLMWSLLNNLACRFDLSHLKEWTIECNPESINEQKLELYKDVGVNRISIGVQSLFDDNLKAIGRLHDAKTAIEKIKLARRYFDNVSADLIIGLPFDTNERIKAEVETLAPLVKHLSMYELSVEEGTALDRMVKQGKIVLPDDDKTQDLFDCAYDCANASGFERYEVSNFAKDGKISLHNFGYWQREEYLGFGAGAHSFLKKSKINVNTTKNFSGQVRYANFRSLSDYKNAVESANTYDEICRDFCEYLTGKDVKEEEIMLALRTNKGIKEELLPLVPQNLEKYFERKNGYASLTREGMAVMNSILVEILDI